MHFLQHCLYYNNSQHTRDIQSYCTFISIHLWISKTLFYINHLPLRLNNFPALYQLFKVICKSFLAECVVIDAPLHLQHHMKVIFPLKLLWETQKSRNIETLRDAQLLLFQPSRLPRKNILNLPHMFYWQMDNLFHSNIVITADNYT